MATAEHRLLTRIIQAGAMEEVLGYGISADHFMNMQCRGIWDYLFGYYQSFATRKSIPSPDAFLQQFSQFEFVEAQNMTVEALCHEVVNAYETVQVKTAGAAAVETSEVDPIQAALDMRKAADAILSRCTNKGVDVHLSLHISQLLRNYELKEQGLIQPAFHYPWLPLDIETGGVSEEDYVLLWGRPKSMKSFVLTYMMGEAFEQGLRVLCYTKEMTPDNILLRTAAFIGRLPYQETRLGHLTEADKQMLFGLQSYINEKCAASGGHNDLIVLSGRDAGGRDGVVWLQNKIRQHKPDICFVDGLYLMNDDQGTRRTADHDRVMHISRDTRQMILEERVPVIATMQANRKAQQNNAAELDEIAFSDAVGQDITQGFRVINERNSPTIALVAGGSREYRLHGVRIHGVPCSNFNFHSIMSEKEITNAARNDTGEEQDNPDAHSASRKRPRIGKSQVAQANKMVDDMIKNL